MNPTFPLLDREAIDNLRAINPDDGGEFLRELIDIFLVDTPKHLADLEAAIAAGQSVDLTRAAHSIKGSSGNFGATGLANLARDMESLGKASEFAAAGQALPGLRAEFLRLHPALEQLRKAG